MTSRAGRYVDRPGADLVGLLADPPASFGPVPIWWWSGDRLDPARLRWQLERLVEGGIRHAVVLNLAPSGPLYGALADEPEFFTPAWWAILRGVCADAAELGVRLWFYDQLGFSGADLQGRVVATAPQHRGRALGVVRVDVDGAGELRCPEDGTPLAAFALPIDPAGTASGEPQSLAVDGEVVRWRGSGRARLLAAYAVPRGYDYLSQAAGAALISAVHGEFERHLGDFLGSTIVGSFQDELASLPTWTAAFATEFRARRGYDLMPCIAALWETWDGNCEQVRADYQRTRAELAEEAFFRPLHEWHEQRGLVVGCDQQHPARAGYPLEATQQYADYLRTHRWFSAPGSDHWGDAKVHSSLAHLYDRPRTWVEAFHTTGWGGTLEETYDWLLPWLRAGATLYDPHAVYYSTRGGRWEWAPPSTCWRQPYWRHYPVFAQTVTRLCAALSWGHHVCDVAVLFPTTTVAAELPLDHSEELLGQPRCTSAAQDAYLDVVGRMHWFEPEPGALDRDGRDFDVVDDDSLVRATAADGALRIGTESYSAVVLPGCRLLEPATVDVITAFAAAGGVVVAVGEVAAPLRGVVRQVATADDLAGALADVPRRVVAPLPTLLRSDGESAVLLVIGAHPGATRPAADRTWQHHGYDFDPARYLRSVPVAVAGVAEPVAVCDPTTAQAAPLEARRTGDVLAVDVPLQHGPAALVLFGPAAAALLATAPGPAAEHRPRGPVVALPDDGWTAELLPTMDNRWGDFAGKARTGPMPVQVWRLEEQSADGGWIPARVTFGTYGEALGPLPAAQLTDGVLYRPIVLSEVYGVPPDTDRYEPRGYVPEEFLDVGLARAGEVAQLRLPVHCANAGAGVLTVGTTADVTARWNGQPVGLAGGPYYRTATVPALAGRNLLELRLAAPTERRLRASWALRAEPEPIPRPQWLAADAGPTSLRRTWDLDVAPRSALLQLGTEGRVSLRINGAVVARHGESDNYAHRRQPRVRRYDVAAVLRAGANDVALVLHDAGSTAACDAVAEVGGTETWLVTDDRWSADDGPPVTGVADVPHDPRWVALRPRAHPLPRGHELEGGRSDPLRIGEPAAPETAARRQVFRFALPPGAVQVRLPVVGRAEVAVAGRDVTKVADAFRLDQAAASGQWCTVTVTSEPDATADGGAVFAGPIEVDVAGAAPMRLGDWTRHGLCDYSGGVRYSHVLRGCAGDATLDLGAVRGTAEVRVDGRAAGVRLWSPYRFALTGLDAGGSVLEVDVYGTLAPYQAAVSPTPWVLPGQQVSGILGPVTLHQAG